jgi:hypothetical protein
MGKTNTATPHPEAWTTVPCPAMGVNLLIAEAADPVSNSGYKCLPLTDLSITGRQHQHLVHRADHLFTLTVGNFRAAGDYCHGD